MTALLPVKAVATYNDDVLPESYAEDCTIRYIEIGDVRETEGITGYTEVVFGTAPSRARRVVRSGDVLVSTVRTYLRAVAAVDEHHDGAIASTGFAVLRPRNVEPRFLRYSVLERRFMDEVEARSTGISYPAINASDLVNIKIRVPSEGEQRAIADFLDRETAQIDAFIAKNEQLITLLTERRAAVTASAVTRGIGPDDELYETGIPWLGRIPTGWRIIRVKFAARTLPGYAFSSADFVESPDAIPLLRGINVGIGRLSWDDLVSIEGPLPDVAARYSLQAGDLVIGMDRPVIKDGLRISTITPDDAGALLVQRVLRLRGEAADNAFLRYALEWGGFAMYIEPDFTGVSVPHMSEQQVGNFTIALPDLATQKRVVEYISHEHDATDRALHAASRSVALARERRAALISAAVTGKIDVGVNA